jgi:hypothetical protein
LRRYLRPGEELIWQGAPTRSFTLAPADSFAIPFTILWFSFACFWTVGASRADGPVAGLMGLPFVAVGIYVVAGRFLVKRYQHRHTAYGVTQDRAMIVTPRSFRDLPLRGVPLSVERSRDGRRVSVIMSSPEPDLSYGFLGRRRPTRAASARYANTGLEPLMRSAPFPFAFYDVEDPQALLGRPRPGANAELLVTPGRGCYADQANAR